MATKHDNRNWNSQQASSFDLCTNDFRSSRTVHALHPICMLYTTKYNASKSLH